MASSSSKRKFPAKIVAMKERKRAKLSGSDSRPTKTAKTLRKQNVRVDDLGWKEVRMPDLMDDFEGFYGLEEVDGVDVIRSEGGKVVSFQRNTKNNGHDAQAHHEDDRDEREDEEWEGLGDTGEEEQDAENGTDLAKQEKKKKKDTKRKSAKKDDNFETREKAKDLPNPRSAFGSIPFEGLPDHHDDEDFDTSAWTPLNLSPETRGSIAHLKFSEPTQIQSSAVPEILAGHDLIGKAVTGSGKTLAFGIPILEHYLSLGRHLETKADGKNKRPNGTPNKRRHPVALVVAPTRELAHQITKHLAALCSNGPFDGPNIATLTGGLAIQKQLRLLSNADVVIGTPGRLWEVISQGKGLITWLKRVKFVVVDEADRLLSEGHFKEFQEIIRILDANEDDDDEGSQPDESSSRENQNSNSIDPERQTLVFSATFHKGLQQKLSGKARSAPSNLMSTQESMEYLLQKLNFREPKPKFIDASPTSQLASTLQEGIIECGAEEKDLYLYTILLQHIVGRTLVFTNSIPTVKRLTPLLKNLGLQAWGLHSHMPQKARLRSLENFTSSIEQTASSKMSNGQPHANQAILISTDLSARGLDLPAVDLVIHYHVPHSSDVYIHRSGRTARASRPGCSALLCGPTERSSVLRLLKKIHPNDPSPRNLDVDRLLAGRIKPRATLAKRIADVESARKRSGDEDKWMKDAAEELGIDSDELADLEKAGEKGKRGRGNKRREKLKGDATVGNAEVEEWRRELKALLAKRVNTGVSERYVANGAVDMDSLLKNRDGQGGGLFIGSVMRLGFTDG